MLESLPAPRIHRGLLRAFAAFGVPALLLIRLSSSHYGALYSDWQPFVLASGSGPWDWSVLAARAVWDYPNSFWVAALVVATALFTRQAVGRSRLAAGPAWLPACYLPTYVFGIESLQSLGGMMRCGSLAGGTDIRSEMSARFAVTLGVFVATVLVGAAVAAMRRSRKGWGDVAIGVPPVAIAIAVAVGLNWSLLWMIVQPGR